MVSYILRAQGCGAKTMPLLGELLGIKSHRIDTAPAASKEDFIIRWGCISSVSNGPKVLNKIKAIEETSDKRGFRLKLSKLGLSPKSWGDMTEYLLEDAYKTVDKLIVRPEYHSRSENLFFCTALSEVIKATKEIGGKHYLSQYIDKKAEWRVFVVSGRVAAVIEKTPKDKKDISWGCVTEGDFEYVAWDDWPKEVIENALKVFEQTQLDFGAIDIITDGKGGAYTLEVNTAPYLTPYYIKCLAKCFKYIFANGRDRFALPTDFGWKNTIHPAIQKEL